MSAYRNVLAAVDGSPESATIISKAVALAGSDARLSVVLVMEPMPGNYAFDLNMTDFQVLEQRHQELIAGRMRDMLQSSFPSIPADAVHFLRGKPANEIKRMARDTEVDLLVIGSHGHNPIRAMLGSTANAVLHGIECDVLTVRVYGNAE